MREICGKFFIFQQGIVSASVLGNQASETRHLRSFHQTFYHPTAQPSSLQKYGDKMQQRVLQVHDVDELKQHFIDVWHHFEQSVIDDSVDQWRKGLCA